MSGVEEVSSNALTSLVSLPHRIHHSVANSHRRSAEKSPFHARPGAPVPTCPNMQITVEQAGFRQRFLRQRVPPAVGDEVAGLAAVSGDPRKRRILNEGFVVVAIDPSAKLDQQRPAAGDPDADAITRSNLPNSLPASSETSHLIPRHTGGVTRVFVRTSKFSARRLQRGGTLENLRRGYPVDAFSGPSLRERRS